MARNLDTRHSTSAPPPILKDKGDPKDGATKICYEFGKGGSCKKGADGACEHVAAAAAPKMERPRGGGELKVKPTACNFNI